MPNKICPVCGTKFYARPNHGKRGKYCSRECYNKANTNEMITLECDYCGDEIKRKKWKVQQSNSKHHFCDSECFGKYRKEHPEEYRACKVGGPNRKIEISKKDLVRDYLKEGMTMKEVADKYDCSITTVQRRKKEYDISTPSKTSRRKRKSQGWWIKKFQEKYDGCQNCGWNKASCDVAHIVPRSEGGKYEEDNLLYLCPNCHRLYDQDKLQTEDIVQTSEKSEEVNSKSSR